jgi:AraC-like DNA-binding protein
MVSRHEGCRLSQHPIFPGLHVAGRDGMVMGLLVAELERAPLIPLAVPFPASPALAAKCHAFLEEPSPHISIDEWSTELGMGRRAFTRAFRRETGMSFAQWRRQACLLVAIPRLGAGDPVTTVALDLGYESPAAFATMFKRAGRRAKPLSLLSSLDQNQCRATWRL